MLSLFLALLVAAVSGEQPFVDLTLGRVYGFDFKTETGGEAEIYLNIPYARPPVGELRFEKPLPVDPWSKPVNGTQFGKECVPHSFRGIINEIDEDCLTLNVIRPKKEEPPEGFPVLLWVHGGGYEIGSARLYGFKGFANGYAHRDVIVVTIQYRVGILGFFSTGDDRMPGNLGLWDLQLGMKFLNDHIAAFGGNPSKITAWGLSAGGAAVAQLVLSPHTRDYVYASIEMSGSAWASWATGAHVANNSMVLARELGCSDENVKECMRTKSIEEIDVAVEKVGFTTDNLRMIKWGPRVDGDFFPTGPSELAVNAPPKPVFMGVSDKDAAFFTVMCRSPYIQNVLVTLDDQETFDEKALAARIEHFLTSSADFGSHTDEAITDMTDYYSRSHDRQSEQGFYLDRYTDIIGDVLFNVPAVRGIDERKKRGWPIYLYQFEHYNPAIWAKYGSPDIVRGSVHINEFTYMLDMFGLANFRFNKDDLLIRENIRHAITTFAHTGKPAWNGIEWDTVDDNYSYLAMRANPEIKHNYFTEAVDFWNSMRKHGYDVISQSLSSEPEKKDEL